MKEEDYINELRKDSTLSNEYLYASSKDSVNLIKTCSYLKGDITFVCTHHTDFSKDSVETDKKILKECLGEFVHQCKILSSKIKKIEIEKDF